MSNKSISNKVRVKITLFPPFSKRTSKEEITVALEKGSTVKDLLENLVSRVDHVKRYLGGISQEEEIRLRALIFHNDRIASLGHLVHDGDSFKFLHPLQGG